MSSFWTLHKKLLAGMGALLVGGTLLLGASHASNQAVKGVNVIAPTVAITASPTLSPTPTLRPTATPTPTPTSYVAPTQVVQPTAAESGLSNDQYYTNSDGNEVHSPAYSTDNAVPAGATAICGDGTYSFSQHHSGTCSHHGGVSQWL